MVDWRSRIDSGAPWFRDCISFLPRLIGGSFPQPEELNGLLPGGLRNARGCPLRFVPAETAAPDSYEAKIDLTVEISTRRNSWHDLFNALVWARFPRIKKAMNELHARHLHSSTPGFRGPVRDALTLFDECGAIVAAPDADLLEALARLDWHCAFISYRKLWGAKAQVMIVGHGLLEKFLHPYPSITANAIFLHAPASFAEGREAMLTSVDNYVADRLLDHELLGCPADLSPVPLMGIPGWWKSGAQNKAFYDNREIFRRPRPGRTVAPIHGLG